MPFPAPGKAVRQQGIECFGHEKPCRAHEVAGHGHGCCEKNNHEAKDNYLMVQNLP